MWFRVDDKLPTHVKARRLSQDVLDFTEESA